MSKLLCPFNESHLIEKHRLPKHILQCKKNYPTMDLVVCIHNSIHYYPSAEIEAHQEECPDRRNIDREYYRVGGEALSTPAPPTSSVILDGAEDWTEDCSPSYLDLKDQIVEKRGVLRAGETNRGKAAKKEFKAKEKDRFQKAQN